jgi:predicted TIM-barrel fold metal-dependent hydrolase
MPEIVSITRRTLLFGAVDASAMPRLAHPLVDTHIHLFDPQRFPYAPHATYAPKPQTLEDYLAFVKTSGIDHVVIVHPEPYQDDHRYLEYCFAHEPKPQFFHGTCLFDPISPATPERMEALVKRNPGRITALRIHEMRPAGQPALTNGAIKDRDMKSREMNATWAKAHSLGLAIQMHFIPYYAPQIGELAAQFPEMPVILDHLARAGQGTPEEYDSVLKLAKYPRVYMKYSAINYSSKQKFPYADAKPLVRRAYDAFGPNRMIWGGLGMNREEFDKQVELFESMFDYLHEIDRSKIRGANALKLYKW